MARIHIISVGNVKDSVSVDVEADRVPTGVISFFARRTPPDPASGKYGDACAKTDLSPTKWRVTLPAEVYVGAGRPARLFYITAKDGGEQPADQYSAYLTPAGELEGAGAVWVGISDVEDIDEIALILVKILKDNRKGIESRMQQIEAGTTVKQIVYGLPERIESYPAICVAQANFQEQYAGPDYMRMANVGAEVYGYIAHDSPTTQERLVAVFGRAVQRILNQIAYETIELSTDVTITYCEAPSLQFGDQWNGQRFLATWVCGWQARLALTEP